MKLHPSAFIHPCFLEMSPNWHGSTPLRCREKSCERSNRSISAKRIAKFELRISFFGYASHPGFQNPQFEILPDL
jgi:hypothetical protein